MHVFRNRTSWMGRLFSWPWRPRRKLGVARVAFKSDGGLIEKSWPALYDTQRTPVYQPWADTRPEHKEHDRFDDLPTLIDVWAGGGGDFAGAGATRRWDDKPSKDGGCEAAPDTPSAGSTCGHGGTWSASTTTSSESCTASPTSQESSASSDQGPSSSGCSDTSVSDDPSSW